MMRIDQATHDVSSHVHANQAPRRAIAVPFSRTRPPLEIWASLAWAALLAAVAVAALAMLPARQAAAADAPAASAKEQQLLAVLALQRLERDVDALQDRRDGPMQVGDHVSP